MDSYSAALEALKNKPLFITTEPEVLDFTGKKPAKLVIICKTQKIAIPLSSEPKKLFKTIGELQHYLMEADTTIMAWNIKSFFSYVKFITKKDISFKSHIFDLKVLESFLAIKEECPKTFHQAVKRLVPELQNSSIVYCNNHLRTDVYAQNNLHTFDFHRFLY